MMDIVDLWRTWIWPFFAPTNVMITALMIGVALLWSRWWRWARVAATLVAVALVGITSFGLEDGMAMVLENRFPQPALPDQITGIIVLGGSVAQDIMIARAQTILNDNGDRLVQFALLARRHPEARLVFAGGGKGHSVPAEATLSVRALVDLGVDPSRLLVENRSTTTHENAVFTYEQVRPKPGESWVLVTSAYHMPRAVGSFRSAGWDVIPYPVGYTTGRKGAWFGLGYDPVGALVALTKFGHEWGGLVVYRMRGWTDALLPGPA